MEDIPEAVEITPIQDLVASLENTIAILEKGLSELASILRSKQSENYAAIQVHEDFSEAKIQTEKALGACKANLTSIKSTLFAPSLSNTATGSTTQLCNMTATLEMGEYWSPRSYGDGGPCSFSDMEMFEGNDGYFRRDREKEKERQHAFFDH
ncbi:hypothetical protein MMC28_006104 [Mycoblastus sanguinarius]|nr:hypothetical protein [Mycoblastus sanguinarius]